jgi:hypothetical protein
MWWVSKEETCGIKGRHFFSVILPTFEKIGGGIYQSKKTGSLVEFKSK